MRITDIEIKNFRAFRGTYHIDLSKSGKNLIVYGENGSGKSSLYLALKLFLESGLDATDASKIDTGFEKHQNIFVEEPGHIKLDFSEEHQRIQETYEWSENLKETHNDLIIETLKASGFLDYKDLLKVHNVEPQVGVVNVFNLLVETLLVNTINYETDRSLAEDWNDIQEPYPRRNAKNQITSLENRIDIFNIELANRLDELSPKVREILGKFGYEVDLSLDFKGITYNQKNKTLENQQILLNVKFFDKDISEQYLLLNEAKLSAIALSIFLSSILLQPESDLRILALDDVLIGLDMSNRLPVLDILKEYFPDHQIFLTTYDKVWYEIVKQRTEEKDWKYAEFYFSQTDEYEIPVYAEDKAYLDKAKEYLKANDYKACAVYLRTAFEAIIKRFCDKRNLRVRYCENPKQLMSEDFWDPIKTGTKRDGTPFLAQTLIRQIELYRSIILNPLNHATIANIPKREVEEAIDAVEELETALVQV
ncbi:hypothetical protein C6501_08830 [Candidatus Poribacteria bacterium]|nr:MAG: hypothetical protein C6501_08830 [Candidatus Poribacteria bacterium]